MEMNQADASRAIQNPNGEDSGRRLLQVSEADDKPARGVARAGLRS